jgi:4'-phosphopantetheinyl transferase
MMNETIGARTDGPAGRLLADRTPAVLEQFAQLTDQLTPTERQRAAAFAFDSDRDNFVAAHVLARVAVAHLVGAEAADITLIQRCSVCGAAHGSPRVSDHSEVSVAWSHTRGYVAAAAGWVPTAVDVEAGDRLLVSEALARSVLADDELAGLAAAADPASYFLRQWVRKECLIKRGLIELDDLATTSFASLPIPMPGDGLVQRRWNDLELLEWYGDDGRIVGTAMIGSNLLFGSTAAGTPSSQP